MDWNWACQQAIKGEKVALRDMQGGYMFVDKDGTLSYNSGKSIYPFLSSVSDIMSLNWDYYKEPKKWTEDDIRKAKAGIELGFEWVARDDVSDMPYGYQEISMYSVKPHKHESQWRTDTYGYMVDVSNQLFQSVKWEDAEPTRLQDIVDSEANDG